MDPPDHKYQIDFLANVQRILTEGQFTATYKYALLLALADLAVEIGDDSGNSTTVPTRLIAEKFIEYYWRQTVPYMPGPAALDGLILQQNSDRQAAIVNKVAQTRRKYGDSLVGLQRNASAWRSLVGSIETIVCQMPLWRLQHVGDAVIDFLYEQREQGREVTLRPGVAFCLRRFHALITELVHAGWLQYIRGFNAEALGATTDLAEFLFGSERGDVGALRPLLLNLQQRACFYCFRPLSNTSAHLDHFIPWARYPVDLAHNFVLADDTCNTRKA